MKSDHEEQYKQVKSLFFQLKNWPVSDQKTYLDCNCQDPHIRKRVETLLFHYQKAEEHWPEPEPGPGPEFAQEIEKIEPFLLALSRLKATHPIEATQKEFEGTSRFLIQKRLGAGGFGVVYQAFDQERKCLVALKSLRKDDGRELYRFKQEFRTLVDVSHPNLITLYELFLEEEQWFFTMELLNGIPFVEYVWGFKKETANFTVSQAPAISFFQKIAPKISKTGHLPVFELGESARSSCRADLGKLYPALTQLATGLLALHRTYKLHGDIKPSNVLVTETGRVVILDFGLACEFTPETKSSASDGIFGTPAYISPEQAIGKGVTTASDWYSVGVMLYEALTGKLPFDGSDVEILLKKQRYEPPNLGKWISGIPDALVSLCLALLNKDPALRPQGEQIVETIQNLEATPVSSLPHQAEQREPYKMPFVGRDNELALLHQAWQLTQQGHPTTVFIKGRSGIGKSSLVRHFLEQLPENERPDLVFRGRCYEQESVPYKALDSLMDQLSHYLSGLPNPAVQALLPENIETLGKLFPVFNQIETIEKGRERNYQTPDPLEMRRLAFKALKQLLTTLTIKGGMVLFIDDLQWGDLDSVGLLKEILQPPNAPGMLFIGSYRSEEIESSQFLQGFFSTQTVLDRQFPYWEIDLHQLSRVEAEQLTTLLLGTESSEQQVAKIAQESDGSPFFISEFTKYLMEKNLHNRPEPENEKMTLERVIRSQVERLSASERTLLEVIAVAGQPVTHQVAKESGQLESIENLFSYLRNNHLLRSTGQSGSQEIDTYHDKIREVVIGHLEPELIKAYHHSLGQALEVATELDLERLAKHFRLAEEMEKAFDYTIQAARQAEKSLAFERAVELYRQISSLKVAIEPTQLREIQLGMATALANAGRGAEAARVYLSAVDYCNGVEQLQLQRKAAEQFLNSGQIEQGMAVLNQVLEKVGVRLLTGNVAILLSIAIGRAKLWLRGMNYQERHESEIADQELLHITALFTAIDSLVGVNPLQAYDLQTKHFLRALKAGEPYRLTKALMYESIFSAFSGARKNQKSLKFIELAQELAHRTANSELSAMVHFGRCMISFSEGNWKEAWHSFRVGEEITQTECIGEDYGSAIRGIENIVTWGLRSLYYQGNVNELLEKLPQYLVSGKARDNLLMLTNLGTYVVYLNYLAEDRPEKALNELEHASNLWSQHSFHIHDYWKLLGKSEIGLYCSNPGPAWIEINTRWPKMLQWGVRSIQMVFIETLHFQARLALALAQNQRNASTFLKIAEKYARKIKREKTPFADGWAELIFAGVEATRGRTAAAISHLHSAEITLAEADMRLYAAAARRRRGELLPNDEGKELIKQSQDWMIGQQIKNPARMADMLAPGNWKTPDANKFHDHNLE